MATSKAKTAADSKAEAQNDKPIFVLKKNHGLVVHGRSGQFFEAGTEFDPEADSELIAALSQSGAILEQK